MSIETLQARVRRQSTDLPELYGDIDFDMIPERLALSVDDESDLPSSARISRAGLLADNDLVELMTTTTMLGDVVCDAYVCLMPELGMQQTIDMVRQACRTGIDSVADAPPQLAAFIGSMEEVPDWIDMDGTTVTTDLEDGYRVVNRDGDVTFTVPGYGDIRVIPSRSGIETILPEGVTPDWISVSKTRVSVTTPNGRLAVTKSKSEVYRYFFGWELFWFTLDSQWYDKSFGELLNAALFAERVNPDQSNIASMAHDVWYNAMWRHGEVMWAMFETVLMAFLGTIGAALVALVALAFDTAGALAQRYLRPRGV